MAVETLTENEYKDILKHVQTLEEIEKEGNKKEVHSQLSIAQYRKLNAKDMRGIIGAYSNGMVGVEDASLIQKFVYTLYFIYEIVGAKKFEKNRHLVELRNYVEKRLRTFVVLVDSKLKGADMNVIKNNCNKWAKAK